ncbi:MAG: ribbon-helix-helix domain-containing protein [Candidatus Puniceispirillales bacterium]
MIKHSLSIHGHRTSVSMEQPFWDALKAIATREGISVSALVTRIDEDRSLDVKGSEMHGLSSAIRVFVLADALSRNSD